MFRRALDVRFPLSKLWTVHRQFSRGWLVRPKGSKTRTNTPRASRITKMADAPEGPFVAISVMLSGAAVASSSVTIDGQTYTCSNSCNVTINNDGYTVTDCCGGQVSTSFPPIES